MSADAFEVRKEFRKENLVRFFECLLNWAFIVGSGAVIWYMSIEMLNINNIATTIVTNSAYEGLTYWSGPMFGAGMFMYAMAFIYPMWIGFQSANGSEECYSFYPKTFETDRIWVSAVLAIVALPIISFAYVVFERENNMLGTQHRYVRVMDDESVLSSGVTVSHNPSRVGSVPVSLSHVMNTYYVVKNGMGYAKYMTVAVKITLDGNNEAFKTMLTQQDRKSLGWGSDGTSRTSSQTVLFMKVMTPLLEQAVTQVFQEIAEGKLQGGDDIVMLRLGDVFNEMVKSSTVAVPSWIRTIHVTEVEVTGWRKS